jgi:hypothetical protein
MSYYYSYYMGVMKDDKKVYPIGPFDEEGKLYSIFTRSRSFAGHLYDEFIPMSDDFIADKDKNNIWADEICKYLPYKDLPNGDYIKSGYFLIEDVQTYEAHEHNSYDIFWDYLTPTAYAAKLDNELKFGKDKDDEHSIRDYMYFCYPEYYCQEYEVAMIKRAFEAYMAEHFDVSEDDLVVLETEG